ncbi:MAG: transcription-repair coupling factor, partial [Opitutaceae bacterium]|nr:transcription-repair coupling factor [Opitutaceae bacterium]
MSAPAQPVRCKHTGVCPPARGWVLAELLRRQAAPVWLVVAGELKTAEQIAEDIGLAHGGGPAPTVLVFPESIADSRDMREAFAASSDRLTVLSKLRPLRRGTSVPGTVVVVTTPAALLQPVP